MTKYIILLFVTLPLLGCLPLPNLPNPIAPKMSSVVSSCETPDFSDFNSCIQRNYKRDLVKVHRKTRSLYAQLDAIEEDQKNGKISQVKAKALAYRAYDTLASDRKRSVNVTCNTYGSTTTCY